MIRSGIRKMPLDLERAGGSENTQEDMPHGTKSGVIKDIAKVQRVGKDSESLPKVHN